MEPLTGDGGGVRLQDIRLMGRALKERWPMKPADRRNIVKKLLGVVDDPSSQACLVQAARALLEADKINLMQERNNLDAGASIRPPITIVEVHLPAKKDPLSLNGHIEVVDARPSGS